MSHVGITFIEIYYNWLSCVFWFLPQGFDILIVAVVVSEEEGSQGLAAVGTVIILLFGDNKYQENIF